MAYGFILPDRLVFKKAPPTVEAAVPLQNIHTSGSIRYHSIANLAAYASTFSIGLFSVSYHNLSGGAIKNFYVKYAGAFTSDVTPYVKMSGTYKQAAAVLVKQGGVWNVVYEG
jgi:hypothetical protein